MEEKEINYYEIVFKLKQMYYDAKKARSIKEIDLLISEAKVYIFYVDVLKKEFLRKVEEIHNLIESKRNINEYDKAFLCMAKFIWKSSYDIEIEITEGQELSDLKNILCHVLFVLFYHIEQIAMNEYFKCFMDNPNKKEIKLSKRQMEVIKILEEEPDLTDKQIANKMNTKDSNIQDIYGKICAKCDINSKSKDQVKTLMGLHRFTPKK